MKKKLVDISKIHELIKLILENKTDKLDIVNFIQYEILEEDKQNINAIKRMYYNNMMVAKDEGNTELYKYWYEQYQKLK